MAATTKFVCPCCSAHLRMPEGSHGRASCPKCASKIEIAAPQIVIKDESNLQPVSTMRSDLDFQNHGSDATPVIRRRKAEQSSGRGVVVVLVALILLVVAGVCECLIRMEKRSSRDNLTVEIGIGQSTPTNERNRDYFVIVDSTFEERALADYSLYWARNYDKYAYMKDLFAYDHVAPIMNLCNSRNEVLDADYIRRRKAFLEKHGVDSKVWKERFDKEFPERDIIYDEIKVVVSDIAKQQLMDTSTHLSNEWNIVMNALNKEADEDPRVNREFADRGARMVDERLNKIRKEYLFSKRHQFIDQAVDTVKKLESIRKLRAKIANGS